MKVTAGVIITILLGAMFVSLFHMSHMDMHAGMVDCPFMQHQDTICPMSLADHLGAWKDIFLAVVPAVLFLLVGASFITNIDSIAPNLLRKIVLYQIPILERQLTERVYTFVQRPLQDLFSNGILHPKVF
jgi:hypothetical protein